MNATKLLGTTGALAAAAVLAAAAQAADHASVADADLGPYTASHAGVVTGAGVTGRAHIVTTPSGQTIVRVSVQGLEPGSRYGVHVHSGRCDDYLGHYRYDPSGPGTRDNEIWLDLAANKAGRASDQVRVAALDLDQPLSIVIHEHSNPDVESGAGHPGSRIACGNVALG